MENDRNHKLLLKIIFYSMLVFSVSTLCVEIAQAQSNDSPIHLHLTWQNDTSTTITVTWQTNTSQSGDTVLYDQVSRRGVADEYQFSTTGNHYTYEGASGYIHNVELTDLSPDTVYYFVCGGSDGGYSDERSFRTAPSSSSDVRFVMGGDTHIRQPENREVREKISLNMAETNPSFVLHAGDVVYDGKAQWRWDELFNVVDTYWIGENGLTIPVIPALGNHDEPNSNLCKYFPQFALPGNERWYSLDWGPDIHIIVLDNAYILSDAEGPQLEWLKEDLETHSDYLWKFVVFHKHTVVSPEGWRRWEPGFEYWVPLFDEYHVDIVFNGHYHGYQRTYPLNWAASENEAQDYSNGTMYITSGGWSSLPVLEFLDDYWFMAYQNMTNSYCVVDVYGNHTLRLQAKDINGDTIDKVSFTKSPESIRKSEFKVSNLVIEPESVDVGKDVTISVDVENVGTAAGTQSVTLMIDGDLVEEKSVTVDEGLSEKVTFTFSADTEGSYDVKIGDLEGGFDVKEPVVPGFPVLAILAALVIYYQVRERLRGGKYFGF